MTRSKRLMVETEQGEPPVGEVVDAPKTVPASNKRQNAGNPRVVNPADLGKTVVTPTEHIRIMDTVNGFPRGTR